MKGKHKAMDIFLSYSWSCKDFADYLEKELTVEPAFYLLRDVNELTKIESIRSFMSSIRNAFCSIILLNSAYFQSENCIYELVSLSKEQNFTSKVIPVVWKETKLFSTQERVDIVDFWMKRQSKVQSLERAELAYALEIISDLNCIIFDYDNPDDFSNCVKSVVDVLYQKLFAMELRPSRAVEHKIILPNNPLLCIDFGTSYSLASVMGADGRTYMIPDWRGTVSLPSKIDIYGNGSYVVGNTAVSLVSTPIAYTVRNLKRAIFQQDSFNFGSFRFSTILLIAMVLKSIKRNAEEFLGQKFCYALLSLPVDFHGHEIQILEQAASIAGLQIDRTLQESSTAALLVSAFNNISETFNFLNVDFGGGTLDISGAESGDGICEILFSIGDRKLGGFDYDEVVCQYVIEKLERDYGVSSIFPDTPLYSQILTQAEQAKMKLNQYVNTQFLLECPDNMGNIMIYTWELSRVEFIEITQLLNKRFKEILIHAKELLSLYMDETDVPIYLTGQGSKLFSVSQLIRDIFPNSKLIDHYQENAVCLGLSQQGGIMTGVKEELILLDNLHLYIDVLCSSYDENHNILHIGSKNDVFYNIFNPSDGISIPASKIISVIFDFQPSDNDKYKISFFNFSPTDNSYIPCLSISFSPDKNKQDKYILEVWVGVSGNINNAIIYTEDEYKKKHDKDAMRLIKKLKDLHN